MHLNPRPFPRAVRGKTVFTKRSWCQKVGHCYSRETVGKKFLDFQDNPPPSQNQTDSLQGRHPQIRPSFSPIAAGPTLGLTHSESFRLQRFSQNATFQGPGATPPSSSICFTSLCSFLLRLRKGTSSKQACAVTRVPGRTKGFDSQQSYMPLFFFPILMLKGSGGGERLQNCLPV